MRRGGHEGAHRAAALVPTTGAYETRQATYLPREPLSGPTPRQKLMLNAVYRKSRGLRSKYAWPGKNRP